MHGLRGEVVPEDSRGGLVWCDASFNSIGNNGLSSILNEMSETSPLLVLDLRNNNISIGDSNENEEDKNELMNLAVKLISTLEHNPNIQHIDFRHNKIGNAVLF